MNFKLVPSLSTLIGLITGYTINGVIGTLLPVPISIDTQLRGLYLKSKKIII
jgi:hypothetical protein